MRFLVNFPSDGKIHSGNWEPFWCECLKEKGIEFEALDILKIDPIKELTRFDVLLWHFGQYNYADMLEARAIMRMAKKMGLYVFPTEEDCWHFDDKVAEMYALQAVDAPIPESRVFYDYDTVNKWIEEGQIFPKVAKLRTGSGSHNVKLIKSASALRRYAHRMFGTGFNPAPSLFYKTTSNVRSSHDWKTLKAKAKRIPEFLRTLAGAKSFPHEKGYVYLQEFIPNDGFDMKVVVVGDKCTAITRPIRTHDFRASGGGEVVFDKSKLTNDVVQTAFKISDKMGFTCMGYDMVINNKTGKCVIIEISYGFSHTALMIPKGYYDRNYIWHNEPLNTPFEIIDNIIKILSTKIC